MIIRRERLQAHCPGDTNLSHFSQTQSNWFKKGSRALLGALPLLPVPQLVTDDSFQGTHSLSHHKRPARVSAGDTGGRAMSYSGNVRREFCPTSEGACNESLAHRVSLTQHI